jgi:hypothetical protein
MDIGKGDLLICTNAQGIRRQLITEGAVYRCEAVGSVSEFEKPPAYRGGECLNCNKKDCTRVLLEGIGSRGEYAFFYSSYCLGRFRKSLGGEPIQSWLAQPAGPDKLRKRTKEKV